LGIAANGLMYAAMLLLRKGQLLNEKALNSIVYVNDIYKIQNFKEFATSNDGIRIKQTLSNDEKLYKTLLSHL
jgi:hypothetical protein